jgi:hypothetical protein
VWGSTVSISAPLDSTDTIYYSGLLSCSNTGNCASIQEFCEADGAGACAQIFVWEVDGSWSAPSFVAAGTYYDLDCWAVGDCIAVGMNYQIYPPGQPGTTGAYVTSKNGVWGAMRTLGYPNLSPTVDYGVFNSVSCASGRLCVAVGYFDTTLNGRSVSGAVTIRNGVSSTVALHEVSGAPSTATDLAWVACRSVTSCVAELLVGSTGKLILINPSRHFAPPGPPINVTAHAVSGAATIAWDPPLADGGAPVNGFRAQLLHTSRTCTAAASKYECTFSGLSKGTSYKVAVTDSTVAGRSPVVSVTFKVS